MTERGTQVSDGEKSRVVIWIQGIVSVVVCAWLAIMMAFTLFLAYRIVDREFFHACETCIDCLERDSRRETEETERLLNRDSLGVKNVVWTNGNRMCVVDPGGSGGYEWWERSPAFKEAR